MDIGLVLRTDPPASWVIERRGLELEIAPADLVALTGASFAPVTRAHTRQSRHANTRSDMG